GRARVRILPPRTRRRPIRGRGVAANPRHGSRGRGAAGAPRAIPERPCEPGRDRRLTSRVPIGAVSCAPRLPALPLRAHSEENMKKTTETIAPHGGALVERFVGTDERARWLGRADKLPRITLNRREISDLEMIAIGAFSPLEGFMGRDDYNAVVAQMRLASGLPWTIPVTLAVTTHEARQYSPGDDVALVEERGKPLAI